jgi:hypothetical protein
MPPIFNHLSPKKLLSKSILCQEPGPLNIVGFYMLTVIFRLDNLQDACIIAATITTASIPTFQSKDVQSRRHSKVHGVSDNFVVVEVAMNKR